MTESEHRQAWCEDYKDDPRVIRWLQANKPPFGWSYSNAEYAFDFMPGAQGWPLSDIPA